MKKKILIRFITIGLLHTFLYLWFVPFVVYPSFGHNGFLLTVVVAVLISFSILATLFLGRKRRDDQDADNKKM
ncbi:MAG: hypothetical protein HQK61_05260 [Desulfamplus sp.]|nr:hypothetical protein [Desulfamplus sp.]